MKNQEMFERLVKLVHTIRCQKNHAQEMEVLLLRMKGGSTDLCCFYLEESLADGTNRKDHHLWESEANILMEYLKTDDALVALDLIYKALEVVQQAARLFTAHPNARSLVLELLQQSEDLQG